MNNRYITYTLLLLLISIIIGCVSDMNTVFIYDETTVDVEAKDDIPLSELPPPYARGENIFYANPEFRVGRIVNGIQGAGPMAYMGDGKTPATAFASGYGLTHIDNNDTLYLANVNWNTSPKYRDEYPYWTQCVIDSMYIWIRTQWVDVNTRERINTEHCNCSWEVEIDTIYFQWYNPPPEDMILYYPN